MSFFVIMWDDGLMVKTLKHGQKSCGFKPVFGDSMVCLMFANAICQ
jgi:hypothetical protein